VGSSSPRKRSIGFAEADDCSDDTAAPTVDWPPNSDEVSKLLPVSCRTESSNPVPSSGESVSNSIWAKAALPMRSPPRLVAGLIGPQGAGGFLELERVGIFIQSVRRDALRRAVIILAQRKDVEAVLVQLGHHAVGRGTHRDRGGAAFEDLGATWSGRRFAWSTQTWRLPRSAPRAARSCGPNRWHSCLPRSSRGGTQPHPSAREERYGHRDGCL